jgi:hypothetical protein
METQQVAIRPLKIKRWNELGTCKKVRSLA